MGWTYDHEDRKVADGIGSWLNSLKEEEEKMNNYKFASVVVMNDVDHWIRARFVLSGWDKGNLRKTVKGMIKTVDIFKRHTATGYREMIFADWDFVKGNVLEKISNEDLISMIKDDTWALIAWKAEAAALDLVVDSLMDDYEEDGLLKL